MLARMILSMNSVSMFTVLPGVEKTSLLWVVCLICEYLRIEPLPLPVKAHHNDAMTVRLEELSIHQNLPLLMEELSLAM